MRTPLRRSCAGRQGSVGRGPGPGGAWREAGPRPTRPDRRQGRPSLATALVAGVGWRDVAWYRAGGHLAWEPRLLCVVIAEPDGRVDEAGKAQPSSAAGTARGPSAAQPGNERDWLDTGNAVTCKNGDGRDRV
jgi:hypothetical protein